MQVERERRRQSRKARGHGVGNGRSRSEMGRGGVDILRQSQRSQSQASGPFLPAIGSGNSASGYSKQYCKIGLPESHRIIAEIKCCANVARIRYPLLYANAEWRREHYY